MRVFSAPYTENKPGGITTVIECAQAKNYVKNWTTLLGRTEMQLEVVGFQ